MIRLRWKTDDLKKTTAMLMQRTKYKTLPDFLRWRAKIVVQDLVRLTPPMGAGWPAQKKQGEAAVSRDIRRLFIPLHKIRIQDPKLRKEWSKALRAKNIPALEALAQRAKIKFARIVQAPEESFHQAARNSRGRVRKKSKPALILSPRAVADYDARTRKRVGFGKWGWGKSAVRLGARGLPKWVTRHRAGGRITDRSRGMLKPVIRLENNRPVGGGNPNNIVEPALAINREKMVKELRKMLAWELKKHSRR